MEINKKLSKNKIQKFYLILFWYGKESGLNDVPNTWCGLTWKTVGGILAFIPLSLIVLVFGLLFYIMEFIYNEVNLPKFKTPKPIKNGFYFVEKQTDKIFDNPKLKYFLLTLFLVIGLSAFYFKNTVNSLPNWLGAIWVLWCAFNVFAILIGLGIGCGYLIFKSISYFFTIKLVTKAISNIELGWDIFMDKYCPLINWK